MTSLRELQRDFARSVLHGDAAAVARHLVDASGMVVYANNFLCGTVDALRAVYPVVERLLGPACFRAVARRYVRRHPAWSGDLHDYGGGYGAYLARQPELAGLPYLTDVARLEWARHCVYLAADAEPLAPGALATFAPADWPTLRFDIVPAVRFVASDFPVLAIWRANQSDAGDATVSLDSGAEHVLVQRCGAAIEFEPLSAADYEFVTSLAAGAPLLAAFERAAALANGPYALDAALQHLFRHGLPVEARAGPP